MYRDGTSAWRAGDGSSPERLSAAGAVDRSLDLLTEDAHRTSLIAVIVLSAICGCLALLLASSCRGYGKVGAIGVAIVLASLPIIAGGVLGRIGTSGADEDHYLRQQMYAIGHGMAAIPIQSGFAVLALGFVLVAIAIAAGSITRGSSATA
jgi:hypothetical protein